MLVSRPDTQSVPAGDKIVEVRTLGTVPEPALEARVRSAMVPAVRDVERFWGSDWPRTITVVLADSDYRFVFEAHLDPRRTWTDIAAVAVADSVDPDQRTANGQRIVLAPGAAAMSDESLRIVLTHELFHYAARADTALEAPRWVIEGVADFVARPPDPVPADALPVPLTLPSDADLDTPGSQRSSAYDRAWWFARFVADIYGAAKLRELYAGTCGATRVDVPVALHDVLGDDAAVVLVRWHQWAAH